MEGVLNKGRMTSSGRPVKEIVRLLLILLLSGAIGGQLWGQSSKYVQRELLLQPHESRRISLGVFDRSPHPFYTLALAIEKEKQFGHLTITAGDELWTVEEDAHRQNGEKERFSMLYLLDRTTKEIVLENHNPSPLYMTVHLYAPTPSQKSVSPQPKGNLRGDCETFPSYKDRRGWCPSGDCPYGSERVKTTPTHLIVHHSAGKNVSSDWDAVVRAIWHYHVIQRGWDDIGYNWLIAPTGQLYEGRGVGIKGAHFCGYNSKTMGVCMMGTYSSETPKDTMVATLKALLTWNAFKYRIRPLKRTLHTTSGSRLLGVSGHRDRCSTECPGNVLYGMLPAVRKDIADRLETCGFKQGKEDDPGSGGGGGTTKPIKGLEVRPTLVRDVLLIRVGTDIGKPLEIFMTDMSGRRVWYEMVEKAGERKHSMRQYPSGIYIIHASNEYKKWSFKINKI